MNRYSVLPRLAGPWFLLVSAIARLPTAMLPIGVMLLVSTTTGSVAKGGFATSAVALGTAILAPTQGRLADRLGQRPVLLAAATISSIGLVVVTIAAVRDWPLPALLAVCLVAGGAVPQVGPLARVRWLSLTKASPAPMSAAMSWEGMVDELTFVLGPALVGVIAVTAPQAPLLVAAGVVVVFGSAFALHRTAAPALERGSHIAKPTSMLAVLRAVLAPTLGMVALGSFFGSSLAAVTGVATALGRPGTAGLLYAVMGLGSAGTALALVALPPRITARTRWLIGGAGIACVMFASVTISTAWPTVIALLLAGLFLGPVVVTLFSVVGNLAPTGSVSTAMTLLTAANVVGVAVGAAVGGQVVESLRDAGAGPGLAFVVPAIGAALVATSAAFHREQPARVPAYSEG